jgi:hypothetical protein
MEHEANRSLIMEITGRNLFNLAKRSCTLIASNVLELPIAPQIFVRKSCTAFDEDP